MLTLHGHWALVVIFANLAVGIWALAAHWVAPLRVRSLWWAVGVAQATIFVQVILGVYMVAADDMTAPGMHMFYGYVSLIAIAIIFAYRTQLRAWMYMLYGLGSLFLVGMALRAYFLA